MNLEQFFDPEDTLYTPIVDQETRNRIRLSVAAYAYEFMSHPIMTDAEFDTLAKKIDLSITTRRSDMDAFFKEHFHTDTGMWIYKHPEKDKLRAIVLRYIHEWKD
jgi:hypothetical protein